MSSNGLYAAPPGNEGIYIATVRAIVNQAVMSPAMARRKIFVIGDAERMGFQEGSEYAANAFLKLLEEPPDDTTVIITSSEPGALLPTIRSRTVAVRMSPLGDEDMRAFLEDEQVAETLDTRSSSRSINERIQLADGAPGSLFGDDARIRAMSAARKLLDAAASKQASADTRPRLESEHSEHAAVSPTFSTRSSSSSANGCGLPFTMETRKELSR